MVIFTKGLPLGNLGVIQIKGGLYFLLLVDLIVLFRSF